MIFLGVKFVWEGVYVGFKFFIGSKIGIVIVEGLYIRFNLNKGFYIFKRFFKNLLDVIEIKGNVKIKDFFELVCIEKIMLVVEV